MLKKCDYLWITFLRCFFENGRIEAEEVIMNIIKNPWERIEDIRRKILVIFTKGTRCGC